MRAGTARIGHRSEPGGSGANPALSRREFLGVLAAGAGLTAALAHRGVAADAAPPTYRAAIIGRTGGGDYGHNYDQVFRGLEQVSVEAIADADVEGLRKAAARSGAKRQYRDFREMLAKEKPDLVCIAPRHPDCHREMALGALEVCRGLFMEKPFTETAADADAIVTAARQRNAKVQVAHNRRWTPEFLQARALVGEGLIGRVRLVQIHGKQDTRAGGEDLLVLGTHDFDYLRLLFGDPLWCSASVTAQGKDITATNVHRGREPILVAGDTVHATFAFPQNLRAHWESVTTDDDWNTRPITPGERWSFEMHGTQGILAYRSGVGFAWLDSPFPAGKAGAVQWQELPKPRDWPLPPHRLHPIRNLIHALETNSEPACSATDGRWTVEMVTAVYQSQKTGARVAFPLAERRHPLDPW